MDLFSHNETILESASQFQRPLAEQMRPTEWAQFIGHSHFASEKSKFLQSVKDSKNLPNLILWGPPGTGKTTFAQLLSLLVEGEFITVNAIDTGAKKLREIGELARERKQIYHRNTILFIDEIHRLNKAQQDVLLPFAEKGYLSMVGATTENPSYELNAALLSRSRVLVFERLGIEELRQIYRQCLGKLSVHYEELLGEEAEDKLLHWSHGDARKLLNFVEIIYKSFELYRNLIEEAGDDDGDKIGAAENHNFDVQNQMDWPLSVSSLEELLQGSPVYYDKHGEEHYNVISAFIKSIRGSDPDAAIYYLARMLAGGEDPVFIARRLVVLASEDVGNADPRALTLAVSGLQAVELVGMPEARINLAQVTTYLASAPKSNRSYLAIDKALQEVEKSGSKPSAINHFKICSF